MLGDVDTILPHLHCRLLAVETSPASFAASGLLMTALF